MTKKLFLMLAFLMATSMFFAGCLDSGDDDEDNTADGDTAETADSTDQEGNVNPGQCAGTCDPATQKSFCVGMDVCWCQGGSWKLYTCSSVCGGKGQTATGCGAVDGMDYPYCQCSGGTTPADGEVDSPSENTETVVDGDDDTTDTTDTTDTPAEQEPDTEAPPANGTFPDKCAKTDLLCHEASLNYLCLKQDGSNPDGLQTSTGACSAAPACPAGEVCKNMQDGSSTCVPACTGMCKSGGFCQAIGINFQRADYAVGLCLGPMNGETPSGTASCQFGQNPSGCTGNTSCFQKTGATSGECLEYCGLCPSGQTCTAVTDGGMNGCVIVQGEQMGIPQDAQACTQTPDCPNGHYCLGTDPNDQSKAVCIKHCSAD